MPARYEKFCHNLGLAFSNIRQGGVYVALADVFENVVGRLAMSDNKQLHGNFLDSRMGRIYTSRF